MLLSVAAVSKQLGIARSTLYALAKQRKIPHFRAGARVLLDIEKVIAALEVAPEGDRAPLRQSKGRFQATGNR